MDSQKHKCLPGKELPTHREMNLSKEEWERISLKTDDWWGTEQSTCKFYGFTEEQLVEIKTIVQNNPSYDDRLERVYNVQVVSFSLSFSSQCLVDFRPKQLSLHALSGNMTRVSWGWRRLSRRTIGWAPLSSDCYLEFLLNLLSRCAKRPLLCNNFIYSAMSDSSLAYLSLGDQRLKIISHCLLSACFKLSPFQPCC